MRKDLINTLVYFDKDNIPDEVFEELENYVNLPYFYPEHLKKCSLACEAICVWIRAVYQYAKIHRTLNPRMRKLLAREDPSSKVSNIL